MNIYPKSFLAETEFCKIDPLATSKVVIPEIRNAIVLGADDTGNMNP
jgi:hypothetical protein